MKQRIRTVPNLADTSPVHQEALAKGDDHFFSWQYNVEDRFKEKTTQEIKQELKDTSFPYAICMEHLIGDFNFGTVVRNANAFNAREMFYLGDKKWDRRSSVGCHCYTDVQWLPTIEDFIKLQERYTIVGVDNVPGAIPISKYRFEPNTLLVFGEEGVGLTPATQSFCKDIVYIEQFGSVRSINVGTASGIVMHEFVSRYRSNNL